ncbi:MAG: hypothetical protein NTZ09_20990 [Candidatus Hydrogenedentes bacterium]|nr:hypothetical protein [Candidatus Hydrogenedentota bacterium]
MELIRDAVNAVQRNLEALGIYLGITVVVSVATTFANIRMGAPPENPYADPTLVAYEVVLNLFLVFGAALAQSVAFSRLGKEIDRPLWKISGDLEAIKKYLPLWAGLNAIVLLVLVLTGWSISTFGGSPASGLLFIASVLAMILYIPAGASLMFLRTPEWTHLPEAVRPLFRQFPKTLVILAMTGVLYLLQISLIGETEKQPWLRPLVDIAFAYFDCVIFAAVWLVFMYDRQAPEEVDLDF